MKKLVPDPPLTDLLLLDPPNLSLIDPLSIDDCKLLTSALTLSNDPRDTSTVGVGPVSPAAQCAVQSRILPTVSVTWLHPPPHYRGGNGERPHCRERCADTQRDGQSIDR